MNTLVNKQLRKVIRQFIINLIMDLLQRSTS